MSAMEEGREEAKQLDRRMKRILLVISCIMLATGVCGGPLISHLYFANGGNRIWLSSFLQAVGFPVILLLLVISLFIRRRRRQILTTNNNSVDNYSSSSKVKMFTMKLRLFVFSAIIGVILAIDSYLYSYGLSHLPVSTFSLIFATNLAFTALFAFFLVKQRFTAYSINAVVLLTMGAVVLAMHTEGDRPAGESSKTYALGFVMTLLGAILGGLLMPLVELAYMKGKQDITYSLVLEIQLVMGFFATLFNLIGMIANHEFKVISGEAKHFKLGETVYYVILVGSALIWQLNYLGAIGVVFCSSSLFSSVFVSLLVPLTEILAVIFFKEKFKAEKGVSLVLSIWGFVSYFYGKSIIASSPNE